MFRKPFKFRVKPDDKEYNERHMIAVAKAVGKEVKLHLQRHYGFCRINLPLNVSDDEPHSFIYHSQDYMYNTDKLLVLVPERLNRVGQWDRRYLFDVSVRNGAMFSYIEQATSEGYAVLITNPSTNYWRNGRSLAYPPYNKEYTEIPDNEDGPEHVKTVFRDIIPLSPAKTINIVAVGYGGHCVTEALGEFYDVFQERVTFINTLDSQHSSDSLPTNKCKIWLREHTLNWINSNKPRCTEVKDERFGCCCLAIGELKNSIYDDEQRKLVFQSFNGQLQILEDDEDDVEVATIYTDNEPVHVDDALMEAANEASSTATLTVLEDNEHLPTTAPAEAGENQE
ncbi:hypothetical protein BDF22DRAFT_679059 [Syncephalis plumigaleata]|nr:hypothetical protein BDF22DRAFT_679059 [Syncephalis plumigaleata]